MQQLTIVGTSSTLTITPKKKIGVKTSPFPRIFLFRLSLFRSYFRKSHLAPYSSCLCYSFECVCRHTESQESFKN